MIFFVKIFTFALKGLVHNLVLVDEQAAEHTVGGPQRDHLPRILKSGLLRPTCVHASEDWSTPTQPAPPCAGAGLLQYLDQSFVHMLFPSLRLNKSFFEVLLNTIEPY